MIRIVSDGTPEGTQVLTDDGQPIPGIVSVSWTLDVRRAVPALATLTMEAEVQMDVQATDINVQPEGAG